MFTKSSLKAILLGGCALFIVSNGFPVASTNAGDFPLDRNTAAVMPNNVSTDWQNAPDETAQPMTAVLPQASIAMQAQKPANGGAPVLPGSNAVQIDPRALAGENPFIKRVAVQQVVQQPVSQASPGPSPAELLKMITPPTATAPAAAPVVANPFVTPGTAPAEPAPAEQAGQKAAPRVDETALRYYASTQDLKRLGAELRRLKALYPEWETPENLFDPVSTVQEQPLWDIYATGNYAGVRAELARLQTANPQWKPSKDLLTKLRLAETRKVIDRSYAQKNWRQIIQMGQETPELLVCGSINVLWQVGEALAQTRDFARSFDLYHYILTTCTVPQERLATVQKAAALLPEQGLQSLLALGAVLTDGTAEFEAVGFDPLRRKMGEISSGQQADAMPIGTTELELFSAYVQRSGSADDAGLFGWYYYSQQDYEAAQAWFMTATQLGGDPKNIEGVVLSLRNMGKPEEAMNFAKRYGKNSPLITKEYIEIVAAALTSEESPLKISEQELATFEKAVFATKSAIGAQALGWKKLEEKDTAAAKTLFDTSVAWEPTQGGVIGSAVIATRAKDRSTLASIKATYGKKYVELSKFSIYSKRSYAQGKVSRNARPAKKAKGEPKTLYDMMFSKS